MSETITSQLLTLPRTRPIVYIGRFCPMHLGHQALLQGMWERQEHCRSVPSIIFVGSCNQPLSYRNLFDYESRTRFIRTVFPSLMLAPMPDFETDEAWVSGLNHLLQLAGYGLGQVTFLGGCQEDIEFLVSRDLSCHIINRFGGMTQNISGTEIRDHLIYNRLDKLKQFLDERIIEDVSQVFAERWAQLRKH